MLQAAAMAIIARHAGGDIQKEYFIEIVVDTGAAGVIVSTVRRSLNWGR